MNEKDKGKVKLEVSDFRSFGRGAAIQVVVLSLVLLGLSRAAYYSGSGDEAFQVSIVFVLTEYLASAVAYYLWYVKVSKRAVKTTSMAEKKAISRKAIFAYIIGSALFSAGIITVAAVLMLIGNIIFQDAALIYRWSAVSAEAIIGNAAMLLLMLFFGVPDTVTGK